jgi:hypothetical protein
MTTELETEVREAFAARATTLPQGTAERLRGIDYRPRAHRLPRPAALGVGAGVLAGAATTGAVLSVVLGGAAPAYAGWSATPSAATSPSPEASSSCQSQLSSMPAGPRGSSIGSGSWQNVLTDVRGPFTVALFEDDGAYAACFTSSSFTQINQVSSNDEQGALSSSSMAVNGAAGGASSGGVGSGSGQSSVTISGTSSGDLENVIQTQLSTSSDGPYTLVDGRVATGVTGVTLVREDGQDVVATVADGWLIAWWPGTATATSAQVTSASGTKSEALQSNAKAAPPRPSAPGSCTSGSGSTGSSGSSGGSSGSSGGPSVSCSSSSGNSGSGPSVNSGSSGNSGA